MRSSRDMLTGLAWASIAIMAGTIVVVVRASSDPSRRGIEFMPDMAYSVPYNAFAPNPATRDGKTLQRPVPGTIPRGLEMFRYRSGPEEALRAGLELRNPFGATVQTVAQGRALYETFCLVCHGDRGLGDGPLVPKIPNPPSYTSKRVRAMAPGQIFHIISHGSGRMPSYAAQIQFEQRWLIVVYVNELRGQDAGPQ